MRRMLLVLGLLAAGCAPPAPFCGEMPLVSIAGETLAECEPGCSPRCPDPTGSCQQDFWAGAAWWVCTDADGRMLDTNPTPTCDTGEPVCPAGRVPDCLCP